jgi:hypothetical protein
MKKIPVRNASDFDFGEMQTEELNYYITMLMCTPGKLHGAAKRHRTGYRKKKGFTSKSS